MSRPLSPERIAAANREYERQRQERYEWRAGLYALWLRREGLMPEDVAAQVATRYPRLKLQ